MEASSIGLDLGGSHLAVGLVDLSGNISTLKEVKIDNLAPPETTLDIMIATVNEVAKTGKNICGVGMGLPINIDSATGICKFSTNFPLWKNFAVTPYLSKSIPLPVHILNDVRVATLGEYHFGAGRGTKNIIMLAIGTGIGGGIIVNGKLVLGAYERAGEIGHMTIERAGPYCNCGNRGCLEALASGPAITSRGLEALVHGVPTKLREKIHGLHEVTPKLISEAAAEGDAICLRILKDAGEAIGVGIANLTVALNPDRFVIGGGVAQAGELLFSAIRSEIGRRLFIIPPETVNVLPAKLGTKAGIIGAATYGFLQEGKEHCLA